MWGAGAAVTNRKAAGMDGPGHYSLSEQLLDRASDQPRERGLMLAEAQVHATLALAAATAYSTARDEDTPTARKWRKWADVGVS